jgi:hypothetical protein
MRIAGFITRDLFSTASRCVRYLRLASAAGRGNAHALSKILYIPSWCGNRIGMCPAAELTEPLIANRPGALPLRVNSTKRFSVATICASRFGHSLQPQFSRSSSHHRQGVSFHAPSHFL